MRLANDVMAVELSNRGAAIDGLPAAPATTGTKANRSIWSRPSTTRRPPCRSSWWSAAERTSDSTRSSAATREVTLRWSDGPGNAVDQARRGCPTRATASTSRSRSRATLREARGEHRDRPARSQRGRAQQPTGALGRRGGPRRGRARGASSGDKIEAGRRAGPASSWRSRASKTPTSCRFCGRRPSSTRCASTCWMSAAPTTSASRSSVEVLQVLLIRGGRCRSRASCSGRPRSTTCCTPSAAVSSRPCDFGFFDPISVIFLKALRWIYGVVGQLRRRDHPADGGDPASLLFPLMHTSTVSMRKMQKLQPKVKEIQEKYKKKKSDPQARAKMNQEMMAAVQGRRASTRWAAACRCWSSCRSCGRSTRCSCTRSSCGTRRSCCWIHDLSAKDPYYITPILMTATMWLQQRLAPQVGDPAAAADHAHDAADLRHHVPAVSRPAWCCTG